MRESGNSSRACAAYDWSATDLGERSRWPHTLRLTVDIMLATPWPMLLDWGDTHIMVVNPAYAELAATAYVHAPGGNVPSLRPAPLAAAAEAFARARAGEELALARQRLTFVRGNAPAQVECDLHLVPLRDEHGVVGGVLCAVRESQAPAAPSSGLRVLVVEDNLDSQYLVCEMLKAFGHAPEGASHAEGALKMLDAERYDVLFSDVSLPGMSGVDLARIAVRQQPALRVIFASGYGDALLRHLEFAYLSLQKPYDLDQLQNALAEIVRQARSGV